MTACANSESVIEGQKNCFKISQIKCQKAPHHYTIILFLPASPKLLNHPIIAKWQQTEQSSLSSCCMDTRNLIRIYSFVMSLLPPAQAKMGTFDATGLLQALQGEKINRNFFFFLHLLHS